MYLAIHKIAIEQMFLFVLFFFLYELPIFAIQNFVNMQISFIGLLQVFKDCWGGEKSYFEDNYEYILQLGFVVRYLNYQIHFFGEGDKSFK